jgi:DNA-binding GntR family transcriptional regulator
MTSPHLAGHPYQAVAAEIAAKIDSGELKSGEKLPSVRTLAKERGVSPMTAQRALTQLADEGYAEVVAGLGYFIKEPPAPVKEEASPVAAIHRQLDELQATVADIAERLGRLEKRPE